MSVRSIRFDWFVKNLWRDKSSFVRVEGFLSELLKDDIKIVEVLESEANQDAPERKFNRVDIVVKNDRGEIFLIELQNSDEPDYFYRMLFGVSKAISERVKIGDRYGTLAKVYSINIVYFDLGHGKDYVYHGTTQFEGIHRHDILQLTEKQQQFLGKTDVAKVFPEYYILKVNRFDLQTRDTLDEWLYYLQTDEIKEEFRAKGLVEARQKLLVDNLPAAQRRAYEKFLDNQAYERNSVEWAAKKGIAKGEKQGVKKGLEKGLAQGRAEAIRETAINLKKLGIPAAQIITATGLTKAEIDKI
ncbi:hypothetical protein FACS1894139_16330 [Planctomycetales bacterium]|nr:hypothetical protein FACS1894139_16330 [Planctomycetales bacterium]